MLTQHEPWEPGFSGLHELLGHRARGFSPSPVQRSILVTGPVLAALKLASPRSAGGGTRRNRLTINRGGFKLD